MHEFESWFSSSTEYDQLRKKNLIECIFCGSKKIEKSIMSPNIVGKKDKIDNRFDSREFIKIKKKMQEIKKFVEKNFEFVGDKFTREVREIYYDNKKNKNIYGTVSFKEREELDEEGIELTSIPWIKNKEN